MNPLLPEQSKCEMAVEILQTHGTLRLRAKGTSMLPTLWPGDEITVGMHSFEQVQPGELVLYLREGRLFLHRAIQKCVGGVEPFLLTRGDSLPKADPPVEPRQLVGKILEVRRNGSLIDTDSRFSPLRQVFARVLGHSMFCRRVALRLRSHESHSGKGGAEPDAVQELLAAQ